MDKICWLDILILLPVLYGLIRGLMRGMIKELNAVLALVLGIIGARIWGPCLAIWIHQSSHWHLQLCSVIAYIMLFLAIAIILNLIGAATQKLIKSIQLGWVNRLLGAVCGTLKWGIIMLVTVFMLGQLDQQFKVLPSELKQQSIVYQPALDLSDHIWEQVKVNV